jgi:hypothetical protein
VSEHFISEVYDEDDLDEEIDLARLPVVPKGRYAPERRGGTNVIVLEPDIANIFPDDESVNSALRLVIEMAKLAHLQPATSG